MSIPTPDFILRQQQQFYEQQPPPPPIQRLILVPPPPIQQSQLPTPTLTVVKEVPKIPEPQVPIKKYYGRKRDDQSSSDEDLDLNELNKSPKDGTR